MGGYLSILLSNTSLSTKMQVLWQQVNFEGEGYITTLGECCWVVQPAELSLGTRFVEEQVF